MENKTLLGNNDIEMAGITISIANKDSLEKIIDFLKRPDIDNLFVSPLSKRGISIEERVKKKFDAGIWIVLLDGNKVIGCRAVIPEAKDTVMLSTFAVDPKYQGKGLGRKLYQFSIDIAKNRYRPKEILVDSRDTNSTAKNLAQKFGFNKIAEFEDASKRPQGINTVIYQLLTEKPSN